MTRLFVYGTLRRGDNNDERWELDRRARFLGQTTLRGARLFDLGSYPCLVLTTNPEHRVVGELFEIEQQVFEGIQAMEEEAQYVTVTVETEVGPATAFVFESVPPGARLIESGDWTARAL